jgi:ribosomal protein L12E/L44/L45/RPP1/RPP2
VEHSEVVEMGSELRFVTPEEFRLAMDPRELNKVVQQIAGRSLKVTVQTGTPAAAAAAASVAKAPGADKVSERALAHPEVRRFQEMFPDAHVRTVRDLKEG